MQILESAAALLDTQELSALSVADLAREAGVAKGTFYVHFAHRDAFVHALHQWFHDELFGVIEEATASLPQGARRLRARLQAFLNGCRHRSGVRSLLWSTSRHPAIRGEMERRNTEASLAVAEDLRAMGHTELVEERARLLVAATTEVAAMELAADAELPGMRRALELLAESTGTERKGIRE
jgi:AcrR family transcriptional regulator